MRDLHELPKLRDSLSYMYVERAVIERKQYAIEVINQQGRTLVPVSSLCLLMLGPGTNITHAAIKVLADNGCSVLWVGEDATRFYAQGLGETRKAYHLLRQAELASDPETRSQVVMRMYQMRFNEELDPGLSLPQIRGLEGVRVRRAYSQASITFGVPWQGRKYDRTSWKRSDPINRAISSANALLNGISHAAIVSGGYSPAIGFIHTGKQLSFVYDIADLYKTEITIPTAFQVVSESSEKVESRTREVCRERFRKAKLLQRILPDVDQLLDIENNIIKGEGDFDEDSALPAALWEPLIDEETE
jgi:CRISPR-associated protein Cas1